MKPVVISGTGLFTPPEVISNEELVASYNAYVELHNTQNAEAIEKGEVKALEPSSAEFIEKASGIKRRHVINKSGILDPEMMMPLIPERADDEPSLMCEMAVAAAEEAMAQAGCSADSIDLVIVAASNMQRAYPAMAVEVQHALGCKGGAFDMNVACSSATFGIKTAHDAIVAGSAKRVLMVNPEICSGHLNFRDRDSHFIFGDVCTAVIVESQSTAQARGPEFEILGCELATEFSNNIRNNFGFLNRAAPGTEKAADKLFIQQGRKVFKEVVPMVSELLLSHLESLNLSKDDVSRFWLHQANINMNHLIAKKVLGREATTEEAPIVLDEYANTSSAGSIIAFHLHSADMASGDLGLLCSFGAGYSAGSVVVRRV